MNKCEPDIVFLTVASDNEATFNKSMKTLRRALMSAGVRFEGTYTCRVGGWQRWIAAKSPDTVALLADPNISVCSFDDFLDGSDAARAPVVKHANVKLLSFETCPKCSSHKVRGDADKLRPMVYDGGMLCKVCGRSYALPDCEALRKLAKGDKDA